MTTPYHHAYEELREEMFERLQKLSRDDTQAGSVRLSATRGVLAHIHQLRKESKLYSPMHAQMQAHHHPKSFDTFEPPSYSEEMSQPVEDKPMPNIDVREFETLTCDSRKANKKTMFFAMPGTHAKGADFIEDAVSRGCTDIVVDEKSMALLPSDDVTCHKVHNIRKAYADLNAIHKPEAVKHRIAVTGTNGKSSICDYTHQILTQLGRKNASFGTLGLSTNVEHIDIDLPQMTTLDSADFYALESELAKKDTAFFAFEASSHGLDQYRVHGRDVTSAAFTNLTEDHLDYHKDIVHYYGAKLKLFDEILSPDGTGVMYLDTEFGKSIREICHDRGIQTISYGEEAGTDCRLISVDYLDQMTSQFTFEFFGEQYICQTRIISKVQILNLLATICLLVAEGVALQDILPRLQHIVLPQGRLSFEGQTRNRASVYIDYAHTPDALKTMLVDLKALPHRKIWTVFGCGGDRDKEKRPLMGAVAEEYSDEVIVTDDNPRSEDPAAIRREIMATSPKAIPFDKRDSAINVVLGCAQEGDIILIAGKGHETTQEIAGEFHEFSDQKVVRNQIRQFTAQEMAQIFECAAPDADCITHLAIDSRKINPYECFVALKTAQNNGEDYIEDALNRGASAAICSHAFFDAHPALQHKLIPVADSLKALEILARYKRDKMGAKIIGVTGSVGKTTTRMMLQHALSHEVHTMGTSGNLNNHLGVPMTLAKLLPVDQVGVIEMGMDHAGEMSELSALARPDVAVITNIGPVHLENFENEAGIAAAKAEIFDGMAPGGLAILNADDDHYAYLRDQALKKQLTVKSFGTDISADVRLMQHAFYADHTEAEISVQGATYQVKLNVPGEAILKNALIVLATVSSAGYEIEPAIEALAEFQPGKQRGDISAISLGNDAAYYVLDESYNASPIAMRAAIQKTALLRQKYKGRAICILGDMKELGPQSAEMHMALASDIKAHKIDQVYCCGPHMQALYDALPEDKKAGYALDADGLKPLLDSAFKANDIVLLKGSNSMKMGGVL